ncbi:MAG: PD-(D/E)XK nuclease family protein [Burkholderiales bacterium]|nr:PD-(D/E)XK nuclease family protein [Burkholderiales bacterium]
MALSAPALPPKMAAEPDGGLRDREELLLALIEALRNLERDFKLATGFNVFDALAIARQEIRHSRFLAFLLDPASPHGLGSAFLRGILSLAVAEHPDPPVSRLDVAIADLAACIVHCERDHFDITVEVPSLQLLFVIENKIDAAESDEQLSKYRQLAISRYRDHRFMGTFLTPSGYDGEDDNWGTMGYAAAIAELKLALQSASVPAEVAMTAAHYIELVERKIVPSQALIDACKRIYQQHRTAFDLVVQHGQEPILAQAFDQFMQASDRGLSSTAVRSNTAFFLFEDWLKIPGFPQADRKRWTSTFPVLMWFEVRPKRLHLRLEVGPIVDVVKRTSVVQGLQSRLDPDKPLARGNSKGNTYTRIATFRTSIPEDPETADLVEAMEKLWKEAQRHKWREVVHLLLTAAPDEE